MDRNFHAAHDAIAANRWALEFARRAEAPTELLTAIDTVNTALWDPNTTTEQILTSIDVASMAATLTAPKALDAVRIELGNITKALDGTWYGPAPVIRSAATLDEVRNLLRQRGSWWLIRTARVDTTPETVPTSAQPEPTVAPTATQSAAPAPKTDAGSHPTTSHRKGTLPPVGSKLIHTDKAGHVAEATISAAGVEFDGQIFHSLSASALVAAHKLGSTIKAVNGNLFWTIVPPTA